MAAAVPCRADACYAQQMSRCVARVALAQQQQQQQEIGRPRLVVSHGPSSRDWTPVKATGVFHSLRITTAFSPITDTDRLSNPHPHLVHPYLVLQPLRIGAGEPAIAWIRFIADVARFPYPGTTLLSLNYSRTVHRRPWLAGCPGMITNCVCYLQSGSPIIISARRTARVMQGLCLFPHTSRAL